MRIMQIVHSLRRGGAERVSLELANGFISRGIVVQVVGLVAIDEYQEERYEKVPRKFLLETAEYRWPQCIWKAANELRQIASSFSPDVLQIHSPTAAWVSAWANIQRPAVHVLHGYGAITRKCGVKTDIVRWIDRWAARRLGRRLVTVSKSMVGLAAAHFGCSEERVRWVPNGVDVTYFSNAPREIGVGPIILTVGTLSKVKGPDIALRAFSRLLSEFPCARLWMAGDGPERDSTQRRIDEMGIGSSVALLGRRDDMPSLMKQAHLLWQLSASEGMPMVVLEAMAAGLPVIGHNVRGISDLVTNAETGILVSAGDEMAVAMHSRDLLRQPTLYSTLAYAARKRIEQEYNLEKMGSRHETILQLVADGKW